MTLSARALSLSVALSVALWLSAAIKQPIRKPTYDPAVPTVELFEAIDRNLVETTVIARNSHEANLFVTNTSSTAVSVQLPEVVAAVQVLKQFAPPGIFNGATSGATTGFGSNGGNGASGQGQPVAGGINGTGNNGGNTGNGPFNVLSNGSGGPLFTVPTGKTIQLSLRTVCLAYGHPDPHAKMQYKLVRIDEVTANTELRDMLKRFASREIDTQVAQAAAWHLADRLTWQALADERVGRIGGDPGTRVFSNEQLEKARQLVEHIQAKPTQTRR